MELGGWQFSPSNILHKYSPYAGLCATMSDTWYGTVSGTASASATFKGSGSVELDYGNCYTSGAVTVYKNGVQISQAAASQNSVQATFTFVPGDVLRIEESLGIIKINSIAVACTGT